MKNLFLLSMLLLSALVFQSCNRGSGSAPQDISGDWKVVINGGSYRLHLIQDGPTLTGNMIRLDGDEPIDEIKGKINKDGTFDFIRSRLNQDFQGRISSNTSIPLQLSGKFLGQHNWTADKASGLAKDETATAPVATPAAPSTAAVTPEAASPTTPEPVAEKPKTTAATPKKSKKAVGGAAPAGEFSNANCPKGWRLDTRSAHNETEFICLYRGCSCEDKNAGKCDFDAVAALDGVKAPKDYTCVVQSDDCTIWCELSDALL